MHLAFSFHPVRGDRAHRGGRVRGTREADGSSIERDSYPGWQAHPRFGPAPSPWLRRGTSLPTESNRHLADHRVGYGVHPRRGKSPGRPGSSTRYVPVHGWYTRRERVRLLGCFVQGDHGRQWGRHLHAGWYQKRVDVWRSTCPPSSGAGEKHPLLPETKHTTLLQDAVYRRPVYSLPQRGTLDRERAKIQRCRATIV